MNSQANIQTVDITSVGPETVEMEHRCKIIAEVVSRHYPNYPWLVQWHGQGDVSVKLRLASDFKYGYIIDTDQLTDYGTLAKESVKAGGELLERLGMKRGAWNGEMPTQNYEGIEKGREAPIFKGSDSAGFSL